MSNIIKSRFVTGESVIEIGKSFIEESVPNIAKENITKLEEEARATLDNASLKANSILEEAKLEVEKKLELADKQIEEEKNEFEKQLNLRKEKTEKEIKFKLDEAIKSSEKIKKEAMIEKQKLLESLEGEVVDLVTTLIGHIVCNEVSQSNRWIAFLVRKLISGEDIAPNIEISLSDTLYESLSEDEIKEIESIIKGSTVNKKDYLNAYNVEISTDNGQILYDPIISLDEVIKDLNLISEVQNGLTQ